MHKLFLYAIIFIFLFISVILIKPTAAISETIVISQVQLGDSSSASNEFIEIYNNSLNDIDITGWCLYYASANSILIGNKLVCFTTESDAVHLFLPVNSYLFSISNQFLINKPSLNSDFRFSATLSGTAGHIRLVDKSGIEIDKLGWGTSAVSAEGLSPAILPTTGKVLSRKVSDKEVNLLHDTDVNSQDFETILPRINYSYGSIYEVVDICSNLEGIQEIVPDGYILENYSTCVLLPVDMCLNIDGLQAIVPGGYVLDSNSECKIDECDNISGIQSLIPDGYKRALEYGCDYNYLPIKLSELLPDANGTDEGNEFIEIYNPNGVDVDLSHYSIYIGADFTKSYTFPVGSKIEPFQYLVFYNKEIQFTLVNTTSSVMLQTIDKLLSDETLIYNNPKEGISWALIDNIWQYTNQPTPGSENVTSINDSVAEITLTEANYAPCAVNQYRSPETNRCRLIATTNSSLVPCKDNQYRSEETNRCRNIISSVSSLVPCKPGQERNPETNRCRNLSSVLGDSELVPCKKGQERNPETNRCRNIVGSLPSAEYAPEKISENSNNIAWYSLAGVCSVASIYGIWEWRNEIKKAIHRFGLFIKPGK